MRDKTTEMGVKWLPFCALRTELEANNKQEVKNQKITSWKTGKLSDKKNENSGKRKKTRSSQVSFLSLKHFCLNLIKIAQYPRFLHFYPLSSSVVDERFVLSKFKNVISRVDNKRPQTAIVHNNNERGTPRVSAAQ